MSRAEVILDQLRDAAADKPYTEELIKELKKRNCHGFPGRSIEKTDQAMTIALNYVLSQRFKTGAFFFSELHELNIPYAVVKGVVLSQRIYGVAGARISGDVDIVLPRRYADTAKELLIRNGFCQGYQIRDRIVPYNRRSIIFQASQTHQLAPFICKTTNPLCPFINYDINTSLHWGRNRIDLYEFLSDPVDFSFGQISFRTLPKEKEFLALCLHHYKDWNSIFLISEHGIPLSHFFDIYGYLVIQRPDIQVLLNLSEKF